MTEIEVTVPDIGDFKDVEVIEVLVKPGDSIVKDQSLITVESDKASMEIPSSAAGVVKELRIKLGDKVSKGSAVLSLEAPVLHRGSSARRGRYASATLAGDSPPVATSGARSADDDQPDFDAMCWCLAPALVVFGRRFALCDLGKKTVLVERYATLGGVCLNAAAFRRRALHVAAVMDEASHFANIRFEFGNAVA